MAIIAFVITFLLATVLSLIVFKLSLPTCAFATVIFLERNNSCISRQLQYVAERFLYIAARVWLSLKLKNRQRTIVDRDIEQKSYETIGIVSTPLETVWDLPQELSATNVRIHLHLMTTVISCNKILYFEFYI